MAEISILAKYILCVFSRCQYITVTNGWNSFKWFSLGEINWGNGLDHDNLNIFADNFDNDWLIVSAIISAGSILMAIHGSLVVLIKNFGGQALFTGVFMTLFCIACYYFLHWVPLGNVQ